MNSKDIRIDSDTYIIEIVKLDYRTAEVFQQNGIGYCCTGKISLIKACESLDLDVNEILSELDTVRKNYTLPSCIDFGNWKLDFLADFIVNIHHQYLKVNLPFIKDLLQPFVSGHANKFPYLTEVNEIFLKLFKDIYPHMLQEEEIYFPYIKQIVHAYQSQEEYASLLVRTLRKPIENVMMHDHQIVEKQFKRIRELTSDYRIPENACVNHHVVFCKLEELDKELSQHIFLENTFLFPVAIMMEHKLMKQS